VVAIAIAALSVRQTLPKMAGGRESVTVTESVTKLKGESSSSLQSNINTSF
jgi:hypothetical protein